MRGARTASNLIQAESEVAAGAEVTSAFWQLKIYIGRGDDFDGPGTRAMWYVFLGPASNPYPSTVVAEDADLGAQFGAMKQAAQEINDAGLAYTPNSQNSGSTASTILKAANVDPPSGTGFLEDGYWSPGTNNLLRIPSVQNETSLIEAQGLRGPIAAGLVGAAIQQAAFVVDGYTFGSYSQGAAIGNAINLGAPLVISGGLWGLGLTTMFGGAFGPAALIMIPMQLQIASQHGLGGALEGYLETADAQGAQEIEKLIAEEDDAQAWQDQAQAWQTPRQWPGSLATSTNRVPQ